MQGVFFKIKEAATNPNLPEIGGLEMPFTMVNSNVVKLQMWLASDLASPVTIRLTGGSFYSDAAGTQSLGNSITWNTGGQKFFYFKVTGDGMFNIKNPQEITRFGNIGDWSPSNQFFESLNVRAYFDISQLAVCTKLEAFKISSAYCYGDISVFAPMTNLKSISIQDNGDYKVTGDNSAFYGKPITHLYLRCFIDIEANLLPSVLNALDTSSRVKTFRYTGSSTSLPLIGQLSSWVATAEVPMITSELDNLLIAMSNKIATASAARTLSFKGTRTTASDAAVAALLSKNYTVSLSA